jgi:Right handed beta helix region
MTRPRVTPRRLAAAVVAAAVVAWTIAAVVASGPKADDGPHKRGDATLELHARPGTLDAALAQALPGDTVLLESGDYGVFRGAMRAGRVTLRAAPGARVRMGVMFNPASGITIDGVQITGLEIADRRSHDLTIRNSRFDGSQAVIRTSDLVNANVLLEHNTHIGFDKCRGCYEGRIDLAGRTDKPSGVTIRDSVFRGGNSDAIQNGGNGVRILDNTIEDIHQVDGPGGVHADGIQLLGSRGTVIRGNDLRNVATGIMAPDGSDHEIIEDNDIATDGYPYAITIGGDRGSVLRGNRLAGGMCVYHLPCGTVRIGASNDGVPSTGTVVEDNRLGALAVDPVSHLAVDRGNVIVSR